MNENLKLYAKISVKSFGVWLLFAGLGTLVSLITLLVALLGSTSSIGNSPGMAHAGKSAAVVYLIEFAITDPCGFALVVGAPIFMSTYYVLASRTALKHGLFQLWKHRGADYLEPIIRSIVQRVVTKQTNEQFNQARLRSGLREMNNADSTVHPIQKRLLNYALKKVKLDDIDQSKEVITVEDVVSHRVLKFISETAEPGYGMFWILIGLQFLLMIFSIAM